MLVLLSWVGLKLEYLANTTHEKQTAFLLPVAGYAYDTLIGMVSLVFFFFAPSSILSTGSIWPHTRVVRPTMEGVSYVAVILRTLCGLLLFGVNTTPRTNRFRGAKVCSKWLQERIDDHNIQSDYKYKSGLKVRIQ